MDLEKEILDLKKEVSRLTKYIDKCIVTEENISYCVDTISTKEKE